jgi:hypothetical protein
MTGGWDLSNDWRGKYPAESLITMERQAAMEKQTSAGNDPANTRMDKYEESESMGVSYAWRTGKEHRAWLNKTKRKRLAKIPVH